MSFSCGSNQVLLSFTLLLCASSLCIHASVHHYSAEKFLNKGNAFVVHGGSEGIRSSIADRNDADADADSSSNRDSYIRYVFLDSEFFGLRIAYFIRCFYFNECGK